MKTFKYIALIIYILTIGLIFSLASHNAEESTKDSNSVTDIVIDIGVTIIEDYEEHVEEVGREQARIELSPFIRKGIGHFGLFLFLSIFGSFVYIYFPKRFYVGLIICMASGFLIAGISEIFQITANGRGPAFSDVLIDYSGYVIGTIIIYGIYIIKNRKKDIWTLD